MCLTGIHEADVMMPKVVHLSHISDISTHICVLRTSIVLSTISVNISLAMSSFVFACLFTHLTESFQDKAVPYLSLYPYFGAWFKAGTR